MDTIMWLLPVCITLFVVIRSAVRTWKNGLFMALGDLILSIISAYASFYLTRLVVNPEKIDLFGLGALLLSYIPEGFLAVNPKLTAFLSALPTAILALVIYTIAFDVMRVNSYKLLLKLNKKYGWSEKYLNFKSAKLVSMGVGALTAIVCVLVDMVLLTGVITFSGNMVQCAEVATNIGAFTTVGGSMLTLRDNPIFRIANRLGCYDAFCKLTSAQRDGETFSVGQELNDLSDTFVALLPIFDALPSEGNMPSGDDLRALPETLGDSEEVMGMMIGLIRSNLGALGDSDAVYIVSKLIGTTPDNFESYLGTLETGNAYDDLTTFCNIAALLADRGLLPESGQTFQMDALSDNFLLTLVEQELQKNMDLVTQLLP